MNFISTSQYIFLYFNYIFLYNLCFHFVEVWGSVEHCLGELSLLCLLYVF